MNEEIINKELEKFTVTDAAISEIKQKYSGLIISGIDDKEGYKIVSDARKFVKSKRVEVEKKRKELKEDSLKFGRAIDSEARRITGELSPIEHSLSQTQKLIDDELAEIKKKKADDERIKREQEEKAKLDKAQKRLDALSRVGDNNLPILAAMSMSDESFDARLKLETERHIQFQIATKKKKDEEEIIRKQKEEEVKRYLEERRALQKAADELKKGEAEIKVRSKVEEKNIEHDFIDAFGESGIESFEAQYTDNVEIEPIELEYNVSLTKLQMLILSDLMEDEIRDYFEDPYHEEYKKILVKLNGANNDG